MASILRVMNNITRNRPSAGRERFLERIASKYPPTILYYVIGCEDTLGVTRYFGSL